MMRKEVPPESPAAYVAALSGWRRDIVEALRAASRAAADVIVGVERGLDEIWIEKTKLLRIVHRLSPELAYCIMRDR